MLSYISFGGLAQLVSALASHARGRRFESATLHRKNRFRMEAVFAYIVIETAGSAGGLFMTISL